MLDEDKFSAPDELQEEEGYEYVDLNREYKKPVSNDMICARIILKVTKRVAMKWESELPTKYSFVFPK